MMDLVVPMLATLWASNTFHLVLSILLHIVGICTGLWIWYLFPKDVRQRMCNSASDPLHVQWLTHFSPPGACIEHPPCAMR